MNDSKSFNILDHIDRLNIVKESSTDYQCLCPICGDGGFKIDKRSGKYSTFKCGCMDTPEGKKAVINAIAPKDNNQKAIRPKQSRDWIYYSRDGQPLVRVCREDFGDGQTPIRWQENWNGEKWVKGLKGIKREDIPIYKYQEIQEAIAAGKTIFIAEGEPACDALWGLGIPATTNIGGSLKWKPSDSKDLAGAEKLVLCPDRDQKGMTHAERIASDFPQAQWLYAFPNSPFWYNLPPNQGLDVADWIQDDKLTAANIWEAVELRREGLPDPIIPTTPPQVDENYIQKCISALYSDKPWIALSGKLRFWNGIYYEEASTEKEKQRISEWCNTTAVQKGKQLSYSYATPSHVENIWKWLLLNKAVSPNEVNPPGINCLNGVVKINWLCRNASQELVPHDSKLIYTYVSEIIFDPNADPTECNQMLSCLEPAQQQLFIQTIAASLDLNTIRKYQGRTVRALLCKGHGNNGKDTLREAVKLLFGIGMSNASVSDFAAYDQGRKFGLSKLEGARINWSSENSSFDSLDRLQSLKAAITGESLDMERKGVDEHEMMLASVFLFNVNEAPNLKAGMEAIQSRWAVLSFNKTYKVGADPSKGEIEADSRFRYDPDFLKEKVCPALLNKVLAAIATLAVEGIDYRCTEEALQSIQQETNHLWAFARDAGLDYQTDGRVYINDLWEQLQSWYIDNGTLEIVTTDGGKEKKIWHDQPRRGDKNVKAPNQIYQRFAELFPKIKKERDTLDRKGQFYLVGIALGEAVVKQSEAISEAVSLTQSGSEASEAILPNLAEIFSLTQQLSEGERQQLISMLFPEKGLQVSDSQEENEGVAKNESFGAESASLASPPYPERVTASPTASPLLHQEGEIASPAPPQEDDIASLAPHQKESDPEIEDSDPSQERLIDWVRYQGKTWTVARQENGILWLRTSGFSKIVHKVSVSQVEIGGYQPIAG